MEQLPERIRPRARAFSSDPTRMPGLNQFILGEYRRTLDERYRLTIPSEMGDALAADSADCFLAKERPGCLSLWSASKWKARLDEGVALVEQKMRAGKLEGRIAQVQRLGRLLSTRHAPVQLAGRGRLSIPEGFREFLGVQPGEEAMVVGAAVCVEVWRTDAWIQHLQRGIPRFRRLLDELSG
jgi:transcriptional regulator MraZ